MPLPTREDFEFITSDHLKETYPSTEWVKIKVQIKNMKTGEMVEYEDNGIFRPEGENYERNPNEISTFIWEEGNYHCDCNRKLFFERAKGNEPHPGHCPCNTGSNKYLVNIINPKTGKSVYREFA